MSEVSVPFCATSRARLPPRAVRAKWSSALAIDSPLTRCAPQAALMLSHGVPHTFSV